MKNIDVQAITASFGVFCSIIWGPLNGALLALLIFITIDYITGILKAAVTKKLNSDRCFKGLTKKFAIIMIIAVANIIDTRVLKTGDILRTGACFYYIANEGISIVENAAAIGVPIPKKLIGILEDMKEEDSK